MQILTLQSDYGVVKFTPYGAQVLSYIPAGGEEVLWRLPEGQLQAAQAADKALRGGIPLCWPWFRQHPTQPTAPQHGYARIRTWQVLEHTANAATMQFVLNGTDEAFPYHACATLKVELHDALMLTLTTTNRGEKTFPLTQALHTYLRVGDWRQGHLIGLQNLPRWHLAEEKILPSVGENFTLRVPPEDRFGPPLNGPIAWHDVLLKRQLVSTSSNATHAVVWQPGAMGAAALGIPADLAMQFICVEPAQLIEHLLPAGQSASLTLQLCAVPMVAETPVILYNNS